MTSGLTRHRTILAAVNALVLGGCRAGPTTTEDEVADKAQEHIDGILTVLSEDAELDMRESTLFAACDDPNDGAPQGRVTVSETFWVRGLPSEDNKSNIDLMYEYWTGNGYQILRDERPGKTTVTAGNEEGSFRVVLRVSNQGSLSLSASSPCVWPAGQS